MLSNRSPKYIRTMLRSLDHHRSCLGDIRTMLRSLDSSGVPQGSVIGPLLFNLYVNDVTDTHDRSTVTTKIFAEDLKMYSELSNINSDFNLQLHLDLINTWSTLWQLTISQTKCNSLLLGHAKHKLSLSIANAAISNTSLIVDLGVTFDQDLKFKSHVCNIVKKAKQRACLIHRCFISRSIPNLIRAFKTYVRPLLEYAPQIWSPHQSCNGRGSSENLHQTTSWVLKLTWNVWYYSSFRVLSTVASSLTWPPVIA